MFIRGPWQLAYPGICNQQQQQRRSHLLTSAGTKYTLANDPLKCFFWGGYDSRPPSAKTYEHSTLNSNAGSVYAFLTYFYLALQVFDIYIFKLFIVILVFLGQVRDILFISVLLTVNWWTVNICNLSWLTLSCANDNARPGCQTMTSSGKFCICLCRCLF